MLRVSPVPVRRVLKKESRLSAVKYAALNPLTRADTDVRLARVEAAEVDEMGSVGGKKKTPRWLGQALAQRPGEVVA